MKRILPLALMLTHFAGSAQQWLGSTDAYNSIYRAGRIKAGYGPLYLDWTFNYNWGGNSAQWAGYVGFNAFRENNDAKDYYYGDNIYTSKGVFEGSNAGFRWLFWNNPYNAAGSQHALTELMALTNDGNLGIGKSPGYKLDVNGTINATSVLVNGQPVGGTGGNSQWTTSGNNITYAAGSVGVGITAPIGKFHVNFSGSTTNYASLTTNDFSLALQNSGNTNGNINVVSFLDASSWGVAHMGVITASQSSHTGRIFFSTRPAGGNPIQRLLIDENGKVGIGSLNPSELLTVNGNIYGKRVKVDLSVPGPDYVFEESYALPTLDEVRSYIEQNKHLPEVPSAKEMETKGIDVGEMNMLLLKKVEEMTLYILEQKSLLNAQAKRIELLEAKIK